MKVDRDFSARQFLGSRETQEDAYAFAIAAGNSDNVEKLLVILADGVGGGVAGKQASRIAVEAFVEEFFLHEANANSDDSFALRESVTFANEAIEKAIIASDSALQGMATTLVAGTISRTSLQWISVGDSSLHLFREGAFVRLNADHSMRPEIVQQIADGKLPSDALATHPQRNALRSALAGSQIPEIDAPTAAFQLEPGDLLVFASDGIQTLTDPEIQFLLRKAGGMTALQIVRSLLSAVKARGREKQDNTTVALISP